MLSQGPHPAGRPFGRALTPRGRTGHRPGPRSRCRSARIARTGRARTGRTPPSRPRPARTRSRLWTPPWTRLRKTNATSQAGQGTRSAGGCAARVPRPGQPGGYKSTQHCLPRDTGWFWDSRVSDSPSPLPGPLHSGHSVATVSCPPDMSEPWPSSRASTVSQVHEGPWAHPDPGVGKDTVFLTGNTAESESRGALQTPGQLLPAQKGAGGAAQGSRQVPQAASAPFQTNS